MGEKGFTMPALCSMPGTLLNSLHTLWKWASTIPMAQRGKPRLTEAGAFLMATLLGSCGLGSNVCSRAPASGLLCAWLQGS